MSLLLSTYGSGSLKVKNIWSHWVDHIMQKHSKLVITGAALIRHNGETAAGSKGFTVSDEDLINLKKCLANEKAETIRIKGVTYCIKSRDPGQFVSFNGQTYIIVCKTNCLYIIAMCKSRHTSGKAAEWIKKIAEMIKAKKC